MITITPTNIRQVLLRPGTITFRVTDTTANVVHGSIIVTSTETTSTATNKISDREFDVHVSVYFSTSIKVAYLGTQVSVNVAVLPNYKYNSGNHYIAPFGRTGITVVNPSLYSEKGAFGITSRAEPFDSTIRVIPSKTWTNVTIASINHAAVVGQIITAANHGLSIGDYVKFVGEPFKFNGVKATADQAFFVVAVTANTFSVSNLPGGQAATITLPVTPLSITEELTTPGTNTPWAGGYYNPLMHDGTQDIKHSDTGRVRWDDVQYRWDKDSGKYRMVYGEYWYYPEGSDVERNQFWVGSNPHDYHPPVFVDNEEYRWHDVNHKYMKINYKVFYNPAIPDDSWEFTDIDLIDGQIAELQTLNDLYATHPEYAGPGTPNSTSQTTLAVYSIVKFTLTNPDYNSTLYINYELDIGDGSYSTQRTVIFKRTDDFINPGADTTISDVTIRHTESSSAKPSYGIPFKIGQHEKRGPGTCGTSAIETPVYIRIDGSIPFSGNQSMDNHRLTEVANGVQPADAVNLGQVMELVNRPYIPEVTTTTVLPGETVTVGAGNFSVCKWIYKITDTTPTVATGEILAVKEATVSHTEYSLLGDSSNLTIDCISTNSGIAMTLTNGRNLPVKCETVVVAI